MPGLEIKLITGSQHLLYFQDEHDRQRFLAELTAMPGIIQWREIELDTSDWYDDDRG